MARTIENITNEKKKRSPCGIEPHERRVMTEHEREKVSDNYVLTVIANVELQFFLIVYKLN